MTVNLPNVGVALLVLGVVWAVSLGWLGHAFLAAVAALLASVGLLVIAAFDDPDGEVVEA